MKSFKAIQGPLETGTLVGNGVERVGQTAIGLVKLLPNIIFSNRFLEIEGSAKSLLPSGQIKQYDTFLNDSFVTGQQKLRFEGIRVRLPPSSRGKDFQLPPKTDPSKIPLPPPGTYVSVHQVYATSEPMIKGQPKIRAQGSGFITRQADV